MTRSGVVARRDRVDAPDSSVPTVVLEARNAGWNAVASGGLWWGLATVRFWHLILRDFGSGD